MMKRIWLFFMMILPAVLLCAGASAGNLSDGYEYRILEDGTAEISNYYGVRDETELVIPETLDGLTVSALGNRCFSWMDRMTRVIIPNGITRVVGNPFFYCDALEEIRVDPEHPALEVIGGALFDRNEHRLICFPASFLARTYEIPAGTESIGERAFQGCDILTRVTIPDTVTRIGKAAFQNCGKLTALVIPESVTEIGDGICYSCGSLEEVNIPSSLSVIGYNPFCGCMDLKISIPEDHALLEMRDGFLYTRADQKLVYYPRSKDTPEVRIPEGTKIIGDHAFFACDFMESVVIPDGVEEIGNDAFSYCSFLKDITGPESVMSIGEGTFTGCRSLASVSLPDSVRSLGKGAFMECTGLAEVRLPDGIESITELLFYDCTSLEKLTLPRTIRAIGNSAFFNCGKLKQLGIPGTVAEIEWGAFQGCEDLTLIVEKDSAAEQYCRDFQLKHVIRGEEETT